MPARPMNWDSGAFSELNSNKCAFNHLLDQLREVHEEVCARNAALESQTTRNGYKCDIKQNDPWWPVYFVAPEDGPSPRRPPWRARTPRVFDFQGADAVAKCQQALNRRIDNLTEQQRYFSEQIGKVLAVSGTRASICTKPKSALRGKQNDVAHNHGTQIQQLASGQVMQSQSTRSQSMQSQGTELQVTERLSAPGQGMQNLSLQFLDSEVTQSQSNGSQSGGAGTNGRQSGGAGALAVAKFLSTTRSDGSSRVAKRNNGKSRFAVQTGLTTDLYDGDLSSSKKEPGGKLSWVAVLRSRLRHFMNGSLFAVVTSLLIVAYTGLIAVETDMVAKDPEMDSVSIKYLHYVFTGIFAIELLVRIIADGWATWSGTDSLWNRLDTVLICSGLTEIVMENAFGSKHNVTSAGSVVRAVRIGRIIRTVRLIRTFHQFHDFQKMTFALISSFKTLLCSLGLLLFVMFFFAVYLTQTAANLEKREEIPGLALRYGDLWSTTYTLFLSVSNGISWDLCYTPLHELSLLNAQAFMLYIIIVLFGLMNVVTSVFVESVIRSVQHYKDIIVQDKEEEKKIAMGHVKEVFRQVDIDGSGQVSVDEMEFFLSEPGLNRYMEALGIQTADTRLLFRLLDCDKSGYVDVEEFCDGCLRLKGHAKSVDIHALMFRIKNFCDKWSEFTDYVEDSFALLRRKLPD